MSDLNWKTSASTPTFVIANYEGTPASLQTVTRNTNPCLSCSKNHRRVRFSIQPPSDYILTLFILVQH